MKIRSTEEPTFDVREIDNTAVREAQIVRLKRIRETRDNAKAVNRGQAITGRTITALATIMIVVFLAFVLNTDRTIKLIGLGMATAILIDAIIVRTVLVPAIMHTFGRANWQLPEWLNRRLPHLEIDGEVIETPDADPERRVPVPV